MNYMTVFVSKLLTLSQSYSYSYSSVSLVLVLILQKEISFVLVLVLSQMILLCLILLSLSLSLKLYITTYKMRTIRKVRTIYRKIFICKFRQFSGVRTIRPKIRYTKKYSQNHYLVNYMIPKKSSKDYNLLIQKIISY